MHPLSSEDRARLLEIARSSIAAAVAQSKFFNPGRIKPSLAEPHGAFVTLRRRGRLRGCVGQPEPAGPLADTVSRCAVLAAFEDERFPPVREEELLELTIEISVLSPMMRTTPDQIELGRDGLFIRSGHSRGLLLPQVAAEHRLTREQFLAETCLKAGLKRDAWQSPGTEIFSFTAEVFSEPEQDGTTAKPSGSSPDFSQK